MASLIHSLIESTYGGHSHCIYVQYVCRRGHDSEHLAKVGATGSATHLEGKSDDHYQQD